MNTPTKLGGFVVALAAVFALALGVGNTAGPLGPSAAPAAHAEGHTSGHDDSSTTGSDDTGVHGDHAAMSMADTQPGGLMISEHGYTLAVADTTLAAGDDVPVAFRVRGPDGQAVTGFEQTHDKDLHFIAVRRDLTGFQHVHPTRSGGGTWQTRLDLTPGSWRLFADFQPTGHAEAMTLGADAAVAGYFEPRPLPAPSRTATVDDYTVTLDGNLKTGESSKLVLTVSRNGEPVTDLQPYLAAYGHLVALRAGDLAYLHVHPDGAPGDGVTEPGPGITFYATAPSAGHYRLFLDFKHAGVVHTAEFTAIATPTSAPAPPTTADGTSTKPDDHDDGGGHHH